jgi:hypothetical protein
MGKSVERPALALRDRLFPSRIDPLDRPASSPEAENGGRPLVACSALSMSVPRGQMPDDLRPAVG